MDAKLSALLHLARLQAEAFGLFARAEAVKREGKYDAAHSAYDRYIAAARAYLDALFAFNRSFPESPAETAGEVRQLVNALMVDADIVSALGERPRAEALRNEALRLSQEHLGHHGAAEAERARAASLTLEGRFNEAIIALAGARDLALESDDKVRLARIAIDLADVHQWLGDFARAQEEIDHAASIIEPFVGERGVSKWDLVAAVFGSVKSIAAGKGPGNAELMVNLYRDVTEIRYYRGIIARALKRWEEAERHLVPLVPEYGALGSSTGIEYQLAQVRLGLGRHAEALELARRLLPAFEHGALRPKRGVLQKLMAECLHAMGEPDSALRLVEESIEDLSRRHFDPDALWRSQRLRGLILRDRGEPALAAFAEAIGTVEGLRKAPLGYRLDSTYLADKKELYSQAIAEAARAGDAAACCRFMESVKSRTLTAVLSVPRRGGVDGDLERQFDALGRELDAMEYQAYREGWGERRARHSALLKERGALLERIRIADPRWRFLSQAPRLDVRAVLDALSRRAQAALTLYYDAPQLTAVLLHDGKAASATLTIAPRVAVALADYAANLQMAQPDPFKNDLSVELGVSAADLVPAPLLEPALSARSLLVVPHGVLHLVPWAALLHEGRRLFERAPVALLPNLACALAQTKFSRPRSAALLGVARYGGIGGLKDLPSTQGELDDIGRLYGDAEVAVRGPLLDAAATMGAFHSLARGASGGGHLLHVSCHGTMVPSEPMSSGLLLYDAKLDAAEVARAPLPYDEVVLSACSTGWRPTQVGDIALDADEILGVPAGFLEAGAKAVLVSIPKAEGKAARALTTEYHRQRSAAQPPLEAFRAAQKRMLESGAPPGTWTGFTLYGCD